jgi:anti-anti-sigma factor
MQGIPVIVVTGRLDTTTAPVFDAQTAFLLQEKHARILLDLSGSTFISSAGLRSIVQIVKHTYRCAGRTGVFGAPAHILEALEISGFQSLLDIYPDCETALNGSNA